MNGVHRMRPRHDCIFHRKRSKNKSWLGRVQARAFRKLAHTGQPTRSGWLAADA